MLAVALPGIVQAPHEWNDDDNYELMWETLTPEYIAVEDGGITTRLRGIVSSMGNHTGWSFVFLLYYESNGTSVRSVIPWYNITGESFRPPNQPLLTEDQTLIPGMNYTTKFAPCLAFQDCNLVFFAPSNTVYFTVPTIDEFFLIVHPLATSIQSLGLPVNVTLMILGFILLMIPLLLVTGLGKVEKETILPLILIGISANSFLRLWPPVTVIFIGLLTGWMFVDSITGGMSRVSSTSSQAM